MDITERCQAVEAKCEAVAQQQFASSGVLNWTPPQVGERLSGMVVRNPAPDASPPASPSGTYRVISISR